ncbi:ATP-dependent dethiobiotin synthetase BioD [Brevibacterium sp. 'Marine']|uniref:ATP-dependent dethiobiotin synthetase BioD n=1 Tax=Brevibacterium sp. 'Marine' TaxID=2725563 RepID=UPI00145DC4DF|nr:ATP-dependent dethiobiotin synthetase BioD [Brevibacterium sp. 'Marine']
MIPRFLLVTGTDTGVGKTIATAALAAALTAVGRRVIMCKPIQTGHIRADDPAREQLESDYCDVVTESDAEAVARLTGIYTFTNTTLRLPMAPVPAAKAESDENKSADDKSADAKSADPWPADPESADDESAGAVRPVPDFSGADRVSNLPSAAEHVDFIRTALARTDADHVLVEGSGGVLVDFGGLTLADIAAGLSEGENSVGAAIVVRSRLGTLNHTALTAEALERRRVSTTGIIIGSWPEKASPVDRDNLAALSAMAPVLGAIPAGVGDRLDRNEFTARAPGWLRLS